MNDDAKILLLVLYAVAYFVLLAVVVTFGTVQVKEREYACAALGYESYDATYEACKSGENPVVLYPYDAAFDRIE